MYPRALDPCSATNVQLRKVPSLALLPRGHLKHAKRALNTVAGRIEDPTRNEHWTEAVDRPQDAPKDTILSNTMQCNSLLDKSIATDAQDLIKSQCNNISSESRLSERFSNMMAHMTRLSVQSFDPKSVITSAGPLSPTHTIQHSSNTLALQKKHHVMRPIVEQNPPSLDMCMQLPTSLLDRQSMLLSPIRRKQLRKRQRKARRARRTWETSHVSWPPHASVDYVAAHSRHELADVSAARLLERLNKLKLHDFNT